MKIQLTEQPKTYWRIYQGENKKKTEQEIFFITEFQNKMNILPFKIKRQCFSYKAHKDSQLENITSFGKLFCF